MTNPVQQLIRWMSSLRRAFLLLMTIAATLNGCTSKRRIYKVINGKQVLTYQINTLGSTEQTNYLSPALLLSALDQSYTDKAVINKFVVKSMSVRIAKNANNTANNFQLSSLTINNVNYNNDTKVELWTVQTLSISNADEVSANQFFMSNAVSKLNEVVSKQLVGYNLSYIGRATAVTIRGTSVPANSRASLTLTITLEAAIEYSSCESCEEFTFPLVAGDSDPDCK